jgi:hypothetical protein
MNTMISRIIERQVLTSKDFTDGLIVKSMAGYPIEFHEVDGANLTADGAPFGTMDTRYLNGVVHNMASVPVPFVPWFDKTNYDILLEANARRNGDLSDFLRIVDSSDVVRARLQDENGQPITLFVPTNEALSRLISTENIFDTSATESSARLLLLNYMVDGNFVTNAWWRTPTGVKVSETELLLSTESGKEVTVEFHDNGDIILDGSVKIIEKDLFSYYGVLQIIDAPLL